FFSALYDPSPPHSSPLSLHDALPILALHHPIGERRIDPGSQCLQALPVFFRQGGVWLQLQGDELRPTVGEMEPLPMTRLHRGDRSEEHTSELQSRENLVCRLLLEKKK